MKMDNKQSVWLLDDELRVKRMPRKQWIQTWRDVTTTPLGIGPRHDRNGKRLFFWLPTGFKRYFVECDTVRNAEKRLWDIWEMEAKENQSCPLMFETRKEAMQAQKELGDVGF
jgi:hypothetical protein